ERLLTPSDLAEVTIEDLQFYRNYILAVRKYKFPDPDLRLYFNQNLRHYQARYSLLRKVPLTQLERLNLSIISNQLKSGTIPKNNES
ncbi:MAG: YARHG domain-containing protein, partial [Bacteroidota bacterium]